MIRRSLLSALPLLALTAIPAQAQTAASSRADRVATAGLPHAAAAQKISDIAFADRLAANSGTLVLPLASAAELDVRATGLDAATKDAIARALASAAFKYGKGADLSLRGLGAWDRIYIVGLGKKPDSSALQSAGIKAAQAIAKDKGGVALLTHGLPAEQASDFASGFGMGEYRADLYRSKNSGAASYGPVTLVSDAAQNVRSLYAQRGKALARAMAWTRDISNEPANVIYPETFVERARTAFAGLPGVSIEVLDPAAMQKLGMGSILGVGRGSDRGPRMLIVKYRGSGAPAGGPVVLAGKGITFDSGGISLKPGTNMGNMKFDMSGAASVTGAVLALAESRAPVDVIAVSALAENMPGGLAVRPGDILRAMNGKTIEIVSTDAEGRLVLADALSYAEARLKPAAVVDVATLTGAVGTALGGEYAGLFSRHDALAAQIDAAGKATGEDVWRLPLHPSYATDLKSTYADMKNGGGSGAGAGIGAHFIGEFVAPTTPWAHIDMANMGWTDKGSAGWGVRLLERFVRDFKPVPAVAAEVEPVE